MPDVSADAVARAVEREIARRRAKHARQNPQIDFERMLVRDGMRLVKFWLHLSHEEQGARFERRRRDPLKAWKLTDEDLRNRARWDDYVDAVEDMLAETDWDGARWNLVAAESKRHARVAPIEAVNETIDPSLRERGIDPDVAPV